MAFLEYFRPDKTNVSLAAVILLSFNISSAVLLVIFDTILVGSPPPAANAELGASKVISGFLSMTFASYVTSSMSIWWIKEYLEKQAGNY